MLVKIWVKETVWNHRALEVSAGSLDEAYNMPQKQFYDSIVEWVNIYETEYDTDPVDSIEFDMDTLEEIDD